MLSPRIPALTGIRAEIPDRRKLWADQKNNRQVMF